MLLLPERRVGQRRIGREGVILIAGVRGGAVLAAELERVESLAVAGEGFLHARLRIFTGSLTIDGEAILVSDWVGSQNHNWGAKHTDLYAWGQVAGFDNEPDSSLEVATARLKIGPVWTPFMTPLVLRHRGEEFALNALLQTIRAKASFDYFTWHFHSKTDTVSLEGTISAPREAFVGLRYSNPPGGIKQCLNTKIASCELTITRVGSGGAKTVDNLTARHRAAFEILTDDQSHGIEMSA